MPTAETAWYRRHRSPLVNDSWDMAVLFDPETGETHFLNELPALLLAHLDVSPRTFEQIVEAIDAPADLSDEARQQIRRALRLLEDKELIESTAS